MIEIQSYIVVNNGFCRNFSWKTNRKFTERSQCLFQEIVSIVNAKLLKLHLPMLCSTIIFLKMWLFIYRKIIFCQERQSMPHKAMRQALKWCKTILLSGWESTADCVPTANSLSMKTSK